MYKTQVFFLKTMNISQHLVFTVVAIEDGMGEVWGTSGMYNKSKKKKKRKEKKEKKEKGKRKGKSALIKRIIKDKYDMWSGNGKV